MEKPVVTNPILIYTEQTPNPETLKFVTNRMLYKGTADFRTPELAEEWSPFAATLFKQPYVAGVYFCNNYVTVTKEFNFTWEAMKNRLKEIIKSYMEEGGEVVKDGFEDAMAEVEAQREDNTDYSEEEKVIVKKIKELIDTYVKPAVEMDGGNIEFKSFDKGKVAVILQGACSGCPSSTVTLKDGIENMLKRMVPEVTEVVAEMG